MNLKRGDDIIYETTHGNVRATILILHGDGSATVQAQYQVDELDQDVQCFLGAEYRLPHATQMRKIERAA